MNALENFLFEDGIIYEIADNACPDEFGFEKWCVECLEAVCEAEWKVWEEETLDENTMDSWKSFSALKEQGHTIRYDLVFTRMVEEGLI